MTVISQDGWTSIDRPTSTTVKEKDGKLIILMMDRSGTWIPMAEYHSAKRVSEVLDAVRYWIRKPGRLREFCFPAM